MKKLALSMLAAVLAIAGVCAAQTWTPQIYVNQDVNQAATPKVVSITVNGSKITAGAGAPSANCAVGDVYHRNNGGVGSTLYGCTATNTWTAFLTTGGVSLQGSTPGTPDTGNINVSGALVVGGAATVTGAFTSSAAVTGTTIVSGASVWNSGTGVPAINCAKGDLFSRTDAPDTTHALYVCTSTNTWTNK